MGTSNAPHIMTLVNSIIGVSILAMPFCYKQCGIILATLILILSNLVTRLSCHYLLKSAIMTRRRTYEFLAFHVFGGSGKTVIELGIIMFMIGTCIAFFVVMGDLGPAIIGSLLGVEYFIALRPTVLLGLAVFVILPLGLLRNVDSLSTICTASFLFYLLLVFKVFIESTDNLYSADWIEEVQYWRPSGVLQCLPIFAMALSCQTQLLEVFNSIANCSLDRMNSIVKSAVNLCTALYIAVGFFGYIAYYKTSFTGNLLMSFSESRFSEFIKLGFVLSVAVTFPMVVFPCRASLHSLLFKKAHSPHYELVSGGGNHIPETQFKCITFFIITSSLIVGLLAPNIEVVLGLLGSTTGIIICVICPPLLFIWISNKATTEKILAQVICTFGLFIMIMGTYANLYLSESGKNIEVMTWKNLHDGAIKLDLPIAVLKNPKEENIVNLNKESMLNKPEPANVKAEAGVPVALPVQENSKIIPPERKKEEDTRVEPPVPIDPDVLAKNDAKVADKKVQKLTSSAEKAPEIKDESVAKQKPVSNNIPSKMEELQEVNSQKKEALKKFPKKEILNKLPEKSSVAIETDKKYNDLPNAVQENQDVHLIEKLNEEKVNDAKLIVDKPAESKHAADVQFNDARKYKEQPPPLPLLMKAADIKVKPETLNSDVVQENVLQSGPKMVEREKRDLQYVTNASLSAGLNHSSLNKTDVHPGNVKSLEKGSPGESEEKSDSFVKSLAKSAMNVVPNCEKQNGTQSEIKMDKINEKHIEPATGKGTVKLTDQKVNPAEVHDVDSTSQVKTNEENPEQKSSVLGSSKLPNLEQVLRDKPLSTDEKTFEEKRNLIVAPSFLSDPALLLHDKLFMEDKKSLSMNVRNSMSRELKAVNKAESGNRKK